MSQQAEAEEAFASERTPKIKASDLLRHVERYGMVIALVLLIIVAQLIYPRFLDPNNIRIILSQNAPLGIIAIGMTFVMIAGGFDLSVGAVYAFGATVFAKVAGSHGLEIAALATLLMGLACGSVNGFAVAVLRINPFIATLGTASIFSGLAFIYSESRPQVPGIEGFTFLGQGYLGPLPVSVWILLAVLVVGSFVMSRTAYGHAIYAVGGNPVAAELSGLRVGLIRSTTFAFVGVLAAFAGMIEASRLGIGQADIGSSMPLDAIAVVIIGGTSLFGGEGAIWRTVVGLLIWGTLTNLFYSLAVDTNIQLVAKGLIVIGAVWLDVAVRSRR